MLTLIATDRPECPRRIKRRADNYECLKKGSHTDCPECPRRIKCRADIYECLKEGSHEDPRSLLSNAG